VRYFSFLIKSLPQLTGREKEVLIRRLKARTLDKIGGKFDLTEGRIRQIERTAILKVKSKAKQLALFK